MRQEFVLLLLLASAPVGATTVSVLINSAHGSSEAVGAVEILKPGLIGTSIIVDKTACSPSDVTETDIVPNSLNTQLPFYTASGNGGGYDCGPPPVSENYAPYQVLNQSFSLPPPDSENYASLEANDQAFSLPYLNPYNTGTSAISTQPGVYQTYTNAIGNGEASGAGVEWVLSAGYKGMTTDAPSWATADMAAILAAMRYDHPAWTVPDVVAALRQTASNWMTGYSVINWGYGLIDYDKADAIASASSLYLQPPLMAIQNDSYYAVVTLYPFRQTRRAYEVIYSVNPVYVWPVKNEYTAADLAASAGTLLFTSNGTDVTPTFTYAPAASGSITLVAFTTDGKGNYSRIESFSPQQVTLTVGTACLQ